jgi:glutaredoxin
MKQIIPFVRERIVSRQILNLKIRHKNKSDEVFEKTIDLKDIDEKEYPSYLADKMVAFEDRIILPYIFREGSQYQCGESGLIELIQDKEILYNLVVSKDYKDYLDLDKIRDALTLNGGNLYLTPHL